MGRIAVAEYKTPQRCQRPLNLIVCLDSLCTAAAGREQRAPRQVHARGGVRNRESERREQQPEKGGQLTQVGLLLGIYMVAGNGSTVRKITRQRRRAVLITDGFVP